MAGCWANLGAGEELPRAAAAAARSPDQDAAAPCVLPCTASRPGPCACEDRSMLRAQGTLGVGSGISRGFLSPPDRKRKVKCKGTADFVSGDETTRVCAEGCGKAPPGALWAPFP